MLAPFPRGLVGGCVPLHCEPLAAQAPTRVRGACAEASGGPSLDQEAIGRPGVPSQVDGLKHWLGPEGILFEVELG